jgi:hypothetical protein
VKTTVTTIRKEKNKQRLHKNYTAIQKSIETVKESNVDDKDRFIKGLQEAFEKTKLDLDPRHKKTIEGWEDKKEIIQ